MDNEEEDKTVPSDESDKDELKSEWFKDYLKKEFEELRNEMDILLGRKRNNG